MKLDVYFARKFAVIFGGIFGVFFLLMFLIDLVEQISRFSAQGVAFGDIVELTLLNAPKGLYDILPLVMILATISLFLGLARSSELVVARASGRSALRSLLAPLTVAALIGVVAVAVFNPLVAATSKRYEALFEGLVLFLVLNILFHFTNIKNKTGLITGFFIFLYGFFRFIIEFFREPDPQLGFFFLYITLGQILCLIMIIIGTSIIVFSLKRASKFI